MPVEPFIRMRPIWPFSEEPELRFNPLVFGLVVILCLAVNWPGRLNEDSLEQFIGFYNPDQLGDLHSPLVAYLWSLPAFAASQPAAALIVQSALIAFYAAMIPHHLPRRGLSIFYVVSESLLKLSLVALAGFVIKDVLLIGLLLAGLVCLQRAAASSQAARWLVAASLLFLLSLVVRPTNFVMMLLVAAVIIPLVYRTWRVRAAALGIAFAGLLLTLPVSALINHQGITARKDYAEIQLLLFDLSGISANSGRDMIREMPGWPAGLPDPRSCYTPAEAAIIAPWSACRGYAAAGRMVYSSGRRRMIEWWLRSIAEHPFAYLSHRLDFCWNLLDPLGAARGHPVYAAAARDPAGRYLYALNQASSAGRLAAATDGRMPPGQFLFWRENKPVRAFAELTNAIVGFRGASAAALAASLLLLGWTVTQHWRRKPLPPLTVPVAASLAVGNFLMHAFAGVTSHERYLHPTVFCAAFALLVFARHAVRVRTAKPVADEAFVKV